MNQISNDLENISITVILPICDFNHTKTRASNGNPKNVQNFHVDYESSIDSLCFSKPLISFTINSLKKIPNIKNIILISSSCRQEQIQEIISESVNECEMLKYICASNALPNNNNGYKNTNTNHHEFTYNRLLKHSLHYLKHDPTDIVVVYEPNLPYIDEKMITMLCSEAMRHGASFMSTNDKPENFIVRVNETNIEDETDIKDIAYKKFTRTLSVNGALVSDFFEPNYRVGYKPEAFKYSIFSIIFENCLEEDLENDIDCIILAKKYADIRAKLVFENNKVSNSNHSKRICCVQHYLKETHKQALIVSNKPDQDALYLQNMLRFQNWNIEMSSSGVDTEAILKVNEMISYRNTADGIVLIKFCDNLTELEEFQFSSSCENNLPVDDQENVQVEPNLQSDYIKLDIKRESNQLTSPNLNHVLFMIKLQTLNCSVITDAVRASLKKNMNNLTSTWYITIVYESIDSKIVNLINYVLRDRDQSIRGQIFEFNT